MRRIFELLAPRRLDDTRVITLKDIEQVVESSSAKSKYPVSIGHMAAMGFPTDTEPAAGNVTNLRVSDDGILLGDVELTESTEQDYKAGKYISWSAGIHRYSEEDENGNVKYTPWTFGHLALLGAKEAAFKDLLELDSEDFAVSGYASVNTKWTNGAFLFIDDKNKNKEMVCFSVSENNAVRDSLQDKKQESKKEKEVLVYEKSKPKETNKQKEKQMEELELLQKENQELINKVKLMEEEKRNQKIKSFASIVNGSIDKMKKIGVASDLVAKFSNQINTSLESFVDSDIDLSIFSIMDEILNDAKPKIKPGQIHVVDSGDDVVSDNISAASAVNAIMK